MIEETYYPLYTMRFGLLLPPTAPAIPTLLELSNELDSVDNWHLFGLKLGMKAHELRTTEKNYKGDNVRCKHEMLSHWLQSAERPTWKAVDDALCLMGEHEIALRIQRKHSSFSTDTGVCLTLIIELRIYLIFWAHR